ncbi:MAG: RDD family protein [Bacteroidales bacterium]
MENTTITQSETTARVTFAGFWWRFIAHLIDNIIVSAFSFIFIIPVLGLFGVSLYTMVQSGVDIESSPAMIGSIVMLYMSVVFISILINWLYYALMESSKHQGTVGKLALRIKVTDYSGNRISFARASGRYFGKILSGMIMMIGYIMAGFTIKKQALHDILANCYVIKEVS